VEESLQFDHTLYRIIVGGNSVWKNLCNSKERSLISFRFILFEVDNLLFHFLFSVLYIKGSKQYHCTVVFRDSNGS